MSPAPVAIVGGGLAGLTMARSLRTAGVPFTLFEASPQLGGLASSHRDADGFTDDVGAHFVTNRLAAAIGASDACYPVARYGESVWLGERALPYPLGLMMKADFATSALATFARDGVRRGRIRSAKEWFAAHYGDRLARDVAIPLVEAWSGLDAARLAPSVGGQLPGSIAQTVALHGARAVLQRAVASGYCHTLPESPHVVHVYPRDGIATLCRRLAQGLEDAVACESAVEAIYVQNGRASGVRVNGRDVPASAVVSTAPINVLPKLIRGSTALDGYAAFRYRPMIFVNLRLLGRGLLPDVVVWLPRAGSPIFRATEAPLAMPTLAPPRKTTITVDVGAAVGDRYWTMPDRELGEIAAAHLAPLVPDIGRRTIGVRVLRVTAAYPVFDLAYESERVALERGLPIAGLESVGRNGEFRHMLMEDVYWRTRWRARSLASRLRRGAMGRDLPAA